MRSRTGRARAVAVAAAAGAIALGSVVPAATASAAAPSDHIANDTVWYDTAGAQIKAQGGNVLKVGDEYFWVGMELDPRPSGATQASTASIRLYRSTDLENWTFVRALVTQWDDDANNDKIPDTDDTNCGIVGGDPEGDITIDNWLGRPQLVQRPDGRFVLVAEVSGGRAGLGNANAFFESTTTDIAGPYAYQGKQFVDVTNTDTAGVTRGDGTLFVDGSKAYLVYVADSKTSRNAEGIRVAELSDDWLTIKPNSYDDGAASYEAPAILKRGSTYYMFASGKYYWDATDTYYQTSTSPVAWSGAWKKVGTNPVALAGTNVNSFGTQFAQIIPVTSADGQTTSYVFNGDRYSQYYGGKDPAPAGIGRNAWYPLTFDGAGVPTLHGATDVDIDVAAGTLSWNPVANGRFSQGGTGGSVPNWKIGGTANTVKVQDRAGTSNDRLLRFQLDASGAAGSASQEIALPNGDYRISFEYKSSGGFESAYLFYKNHGGTEQHPSINAAAATWTTVTADVTVSTGKLALGFWVNGAAGTWLAVDNVRIEAR